MDIFLIFMKGCCVSSLELPHRGNSNKYTQYTCTIFHVKRKITLNYPKAAGMGFFFKNEFEIAVVNEASVFEPPKVYCNNKGLPRFIDCTLAQEVVYQVSMSLVICSDLVGWLYCCFTSTVNI